MGFFDRFRKDEGNQGAGRQNDPLQGIIAAYGMKKAKPYEPSIEQDWWEGHYGALLMAIQGHGSGLIVYLGDIAEVSEIYLGRVHPGSSVPANSPQRLDRIVGAQGAALARQFVLLSHPQGDFDYPQLRLPALLHGIPRLSHTIDEIAIYDNFRGLFFIAKLPYSRIDLENDLRLAAEMVAMLQASA